MAERLRVVGGRASFTYPVGASLDRIRQAGGRSKLTDAERAGLTTRTVYPGDWCDDMPSESAAVYLERGWIERVTVPEE